MGNDLYYSVSSEGRKAEARIEELSVKLFEANDKRINAEMKASFWRDMTFSSLIFFIVTLILLGIAIYN